MSITALVLSGCASPPSAPRAATTTVTVSTSPAPTPSVEIRDEPLISDWDTPFGSQGKLLASIDEAKALITAFSVVTPGGLGTPKGTYVPSEKRPPDGMAVIIVYDSDKYGRVWVAESLPDIESDVDREAYYEGRVSENGAPEIIATAEIVTVRVGETGFLQYSSDPTVNPTSIYPTNIQWLENGVQFQVLGPTLTTDQAVEIANGF